MSQEPPHFRAPMRSRRDDIDRYAGVDRALLHDVCGLGGRLPSPPMDLSSAVVDTEAAYGDRSARRLIRFAEAPDGAVVWTLDAEGGVHRGQLAGPWTYDDRPEAYAVDLVHLRPCVWHLVRRDRVPAAVLATFRRGGRNFQRITSLGSASRSS